MTIHFKATIFSKNGFFHFKGTGVTTELLEAKIVLAFILPVVYLRKVRGASDTNFQGASGRDLIIDASRIP